MSFERFLQRAYLALCRSSDACVPQPIEPVHNDVSHSPNRVCSTNRNGCERSWTGRWVDLAVCDVRREQGVGVAKGGSRATPTFQTLKRS